VIVSSDCAGKSRGGPLTPGKFDFQAGPRQWYERYSGVRYVSIILWNRNARIEGSARPFGFWLGTNVTRDERLHLGHKLPTSEDKMQSPQRSTLVRFANDLEESSLEESLGGIEDELLE
jgi:hypothetical protein